MAEQQPKFNEIAIAKGKNDITRGWYELLLTHQDDILRTKGAGDIKIYEEVLEDDQIKSCLQQRFSAVISCEWEVEAGGDRRNDKKAADFIRDQIKAIKWDDVTEKMLYGVFYGYSIAECLWKRDKSNKSIILIDQIKVRNRRRFRFDPDHKPRLITFQNFTKGEELDDRKFWYFSCGGDNSDDPYGRGLAHWLYWAAFFKRNLTRLWLAWLESIARGRRIGKYQEGTTVEDQQRLLRAVAAVGEDAGVIIPDTMAIEFAELAKNSGDYSVLYGKLNEAISKIVLSQTMTTDNGSSRSQAEVHQGVAQRIVKADADLICQSFNESVIRWLVDWNFPGAEYPRVWREVEQQEDLNVRAERDTKIIGWGFQPKPEYIRDTYGDSWVLPEEKDSDRVALNGSQVDSLLQILQLVTNQQIPIAALDDVLMLAFPSMAAEQVQSLVQKIQAEMQAANAPQDGIAPDGEPIAEAPAPEIDPATLPDLDTIAASFGEGGEVEYEYEFLEYPSLEEAIAFLDGSLSFAARRSSARRTPVRRSVRGQNLTPSRTTEKDDCNKGLSCGLSCISVRRTCRQDLTEQQKALKDKIVNDANRAGDRELTQPTQPAQAAKRTSAKQATADTPKDQTARPGIHSRFIDRGREFVGDRLGGQSSNAELDRLRKEQKEAESEIDKLWDTGDDVFSSPAWKRSVEAGKRVKELENNQKTAALESMQEIRNRLQRISRENAEELASKTKILKSATKRISEEELRSTLADFYQITGGKGGDSLKTISYDRARAYADPDGRLNIGKNDSREEFEETFWHEMGHHVEFEDREVREAMSSWVKSRSPDTKRKTMNEITGQTHWDDNELAYSDKFIDPYVGKVYDEGFTEVISMGLQHFTSPELMQQLYEKDQEHFFLILGILDND